MMKGKIMATTLKGRSVQLNRTINGAAAAKPAAKPPRSNGIPATKPQAARLFSPSAGPTRGPQPAAAIPDDTRRIAQGDTADFPISVGYDVPVHKQVSLSVQSTY
jgi:hypothetical protein